MKSINFKRQESVLRVGDQDSGPSRPPFNWDRVIYFSILAILLFFLLRWLVLSNLYIEADGEIMIESRKIQNVDDSRIIAFHVKEGDEVEKGDTLFTFSTDKEFLNGLSGSGLSSISVGDINVQKSKSPDWIEKEIFSTKKQIAMNNAQISENKQMIRELKTDLARIEQEVILDVLPKSNLDNIKSQIARHKADIQQQYVENNYLTTYLEELYALQALQTEQEMTSGGININAGSSGGSGEDNRIRPFLSPIDGTVTRIFKSDYEVALKSEEIMWLHKPENIRIKAYFDQEDSDDLKIGDEVTVVFPNGDKSKGFIEKFHFTTSKISETFQKQYEPPKRSILVDIAPLNELELKKWPAIYRLGVVVRISKFGL